MTQGAEPRPRRKRRWRVLFASLALSLLGAEVCARTALAVLDAMPKPKPGDGSHAELIDMIQPATHEDIVYELRPDLDCRFAGARIQTNACGWRGPEPTSEKPANGFRVLALGDSVLFGWGVPWEQTFAPRLQQQLAAAMPGRPVDVIGTGVPGYNTAMEAVVLREKALRFCPDVVLVDFVGNDFELPNFLLEPVDFLRLDHCYLVDLARRAWRSTWLDPRTPFQWAPSVGDGRFEADPARVPPAYRHLVGPAAYRAALQSIQALGREHGFAVLVTCHHSLSPAASAICAELGVPVQSTSPRIDAWLRANGHADYRGSPLTVAADDPHPSALLHGMWAEDVCAKLQQLGWLPR